MSGDLAAIERARALAAVLVGSLEQLPPGLWAMQAAGVVRQLADDLQYQAGQARGVEAMSPVEARRATAFHEAAHVVCALVVGVPVTGTDLTPAAGRSGATWLTWSSWAAASHPLAPDRQEVEARVMVYLAGAIGVRLAGGSDPAAHAGGSGDLRSLAPLLHRLEVRGEAETGAYLHWLSVRVRRLLEAHWHAVEAVAAALLARGTLGGAEIRAVMGEAQQAAERPRELTVRRPDRARRRRTAWPESSDGTDGELPRAAAACALTPDLAGE